MVVKVLAIVSLIRFVFLSALRLKGIKLMHNGELLSVYDLVVIVISELRSQWVAGSNLGQKTTFHD
jgi:hypothetical protein